jgi:NTP pyrophosphatase (non-canonical NTP hydrolase)
MERDRISRVAIMSALKQIAEHTEEELEKKGYGTYASIHEVLGVVTEEYIEMSEAVHKNDHTALKEELLDIATACHFAIACLDSGTLDW